MSRFQFIGKIEMPSKFSENVLFVLSRVTKYNNSEKHTCKKGKGKLSLYRKGTCIYRYEV